VAIKRIQLGPGLKLANKYLGPYSIIKVLRNDRYVVQKVGEHEGPSRTSTSADHIKPWVSSLSDDSEDECEDEDIRGQMSLQNGRMYTRLVHCNALVPITCNIRVSRLVTHGLRLSVIYVLSAL